MRMLNAISMKRYRNAVGRSLRRTRKRFAGVGSRRRSQSRSRSRSPWGPFVALGTHLRLQAKDGRRAAAVQLRPGLYLVAEVPGENLKPEFGVVPLLAPLMVAAAQAAIKGRKRKRQRPQLPGPVADWADETDVDAALDVEDPLPRREVDHG